MLARGLLLLSAAAASTVLAATSSSGCGKDAPYKLKKLSPAWIESDNNNRTFYVNLPSSYDSNTAVPLILSYHGNGRSAKEQVSIDQFTNETWNPNSIVVYPEMDGAWQVAPYADSGVDDLQFTADLLSNLTSTLCIDTDRVYCSGKSIGGGMCNMLACDSTLSASFAAIAPVAGAFYDNPTDKSFSSTCNPSHQMPILEFHSSSDPLIPYSGGETNGVDLPSIASWAKNWSIADGCASSVSPSATHFNNSKVLLATYSCNGAQNVVQHYEIDNLGHTWPSQGWNLDNSGDGSYIDASPIILEFFSNWTLNAGAESSASASSGSSTATATGASGTAKASASATKTGHSSSSTGGATMATVFPGLVGALALGVVVL